MNPIDRDIIMMLGEIRNVPEIIRLAKEVLKSMPKGEERDNLIRIMQNLKHDLIDLDVYLQDLQLTLNYRDLTREDREY